MTSSPVQHAVLVRWKADFTLGTRHKLDHLASSMADSIPGIASVQSGSSTSPEGLEGRFDWGLFVTFATPSHRDAYLTHPAHQPVKELITSWASEVVVFDLGG